MQVREPAVWYSERKAFHEDRIMCRVTGVRLRGSHLSGTFQTWKSTRNTLRPATLSSSPSHALCAPSRASA